MTIHWDSLLTVFTVSLGATIAVVVLVTLAMLGLSARAAMTTGPRDTTRAPMFSPAVGTAVAALCITAVTLIVLLGLWAIITK